jgi:hypothetical protein
VIIDLRCACREPLMRFLAPPFDVGAEFGLAVSLLAKARSLRWRAVPVSSTRLIGYLRIPRGTLRVGCCCRSLIGIHRDRMRLLSRTACRRKELHRGAD